MKLNIDRDDDPHLRDLDGEDVDAYERFGDACYFAYVDGERVLVAEHELVEDGDSA